MKEMLFAFIILQQRERLMADYSLNKQWNILRGIVRYFVPSKQIEPILAIDMIEMASICFSTRNDNTSSASMYKQFFVL